MINSILKSLSVLLVLLLISRCGDDEGPVIIPGKYSSGIFIVNEGPFLTGTGTITFTDRNGGTVEQEIFQTANNRPLGNIAQSLQVHEGKAYIVVNNANKLEVVALDDFSSIGLVNYLPLPRYFLGLNSTKGYVSSWGSDGVSGQVDVVDLQSLAVTKTIQTGSGSEQMAIVGSSLFVCNGGGFGTDSTVSVINTQTDELEETIVVGGNPRSMQVDASGIVWIACSGVQVYDADFNIILDESSVGSLVRVDPNSRQVLSVLEFPDIFSAPSSLVSGDGGNILYYLSSGSIYSQDVNSGSLSSSPIVQSFFYGLGYDPDDRLLYGADAGDFSSNGRVIRYSNSGTAQDTISTGIIPTDFYFN